MEGIYHITIIGVAMFGLLLGGLLIDLDHSGSLRCKLRNIWRLDPDCPTVKGFLHRPLVMIGLAVFFICTGLGIIIHYVMDYLVMR